MNTTDEQAKAARRIAAALAIANDERAHIGERENAAARAAELMTKYSIDEAQARASRGEAPEGLKITPFAVFGADGNGQARAELAASIAQAMGCRAIHKPTPAPGPYTVILAGAQSDVDSLRLLLPLILAQAQYAAIDATAPEQRRQRNYLPSFLVGYGQTVAERIAARRRPLTDEKANPGAAIVLADRAERLAALIAERFGDLTTFAGTRARADGAAAGRNAGRSADIGDPRMTTGARRALSG
jgi:hypothetical protein